MTTPAWLADEPDAYVAEVLDLAAHADWLGDGAFDDHRVGECSQCDAIRVRRDR